MENINRFPVLSSESEIHLTPDGGTFFWKDGQVALTTVQADFLSMCDGNHRLGQIWSDQWTGTPQDLKFLFFISWLMDSGHLEYTDSPQNRDFKITGSKHAYIPPHLIVELTDGCNLKCRHCYRDSSHANTHMPTKTLLSILENLCSMGLKSVELTGGEPFLHEDSVPIIKWCIDKRLQTGILTNGTIIPEDVITDIKKSSDSVFFSVSLDASTAESHDRRRGFKGAFQSTVENIRRLVKNGYNVRVSMSVDQENFEDIEETLLLARELGAAAFSYTPVLPFGRAEKWATTGWNMDAKAIASFESEFAEKYKGFVTVFSSESIQEILKEGCGAGHRVYAMDPWGNIRPCATFGIDEFVLGNLAKQSVDEVFSHPAIKALSKLPVPGKDICGDCNYLSFCSYCGLRGIKGSTLTKDCVWIKDPRVQDLMNYYKT